MPAFKVGDWVEVIDEVIVGKVTQVGSQEITIKTSDGFSMQFETRELVKKANSNDLKVSNYDIAQIKLEKESSKKRHQIATKPKARNAPKMEVDLHIGQLTPQTKKLSNYEMLNLQLSTAKRQLEFAIQKRIQKVVFIHGVGQGVLREELYYLFRRYDNVKYYDADYQKYGLGATEVYIFQNS